MTRLTALFLTAALLATAGIASAQSYSGDDYDDGSPYYDDDDGQTDYAQVLDVRPIIVDSRGPAYRQQCWQGPAQGYYTAARPPSSAAPVLGAIVGGLIGNQFSLGHGRGRFGHHHSGGRGVTTLAGAALGYALVRDSQRPYYYGGYRQPATVQRCRAMPSQAYNDERVEGYEVTYQYNGRTYRTTTPYHPGDRIRVRIDVQPED